jgi:hypothetical protein
MSKPMVPKMCFADPKGSAEHFPGDPWIRLFTFLIKRIGLQFLKNNRGTSCLAMCLLRMTVRISS